MTKESIEKMKAAMRTLKTECEKEVICPDGCPMYKICYEDDDEITVVEDWEIDED